MKQVSHLILAKFGGGAAAPLHAPSPVLLALASLSKSNRSRGIDLFSHNHVSNPVVLVVLIYCKELHILNKRIHIFEAI